MPFFETPEPISVVVDISVGNVRVAASERADTAVEVRPSLEADKSDVEAAAQTRVDFSDGTLRVTGPKRLFDFSKRTRSVDVTIELPAGSREEAELRACTVVGTVVLPSDRCGASGVPSILRREV